MLGLLYALFSYLCFGAIVIAQALFLLGQSLPFPLPLHADASFWPALSPWFAAAIDIGLIVVFGLQHSVMARPGFKRWFTRLVPTHLERSTYMLAASMVLAVLFIGWQPLPGIVWQVSDPLTANLLWALQGFGWFLLVAATFMINHFELFGLAQAWRHWRNQPTPDDGFRTAWLYRHMRHPIYTGWLLTFWATPLMSVSHLLFAIGMSLYILVGIAYEERDLIAAFGDRYRDYRARVPALIPGFKLKG
jgi:protein-S-isoprenylcysteine O-methyltransferase Ste14